MQTAGSHSPGTLAVIDFGTVVEGLLERPVRSIALDEVRRAIGDTNSLRPRGMIEGGGRQWPRGTYVVRTARNAESLHDRLDAARPAGDGQREPAPTSRHLLADRLRSTAHGLGHPEPRGVLCGGEPRLGRRQRLGRGLAQDLLEPQHPLGLEVEHLPVDDDRPAGTVKVTLSRGDEHMFVAVTDEGEGLSETQQARLFQPFNRLGAEGWELVSYHSSGAGTWGFEQFWLKRQSSS